MLGSRPMNTNTAAAAKRCVSPVSVARDYSWVFALIALKLDDVHASVDDELGIGPQCSWSTDEAESPDRASTRTRPANSERCSPSSKAEFPPPMTITSSTPL